MLILPLLAICLGFLLSSTLGPTVEAVFVAWGFVSSCYFLLCDDLESLLSSRFVRLRDINLDLNALVVAHSVLQNGFFELICMFFYELFAGRLELLVPLLHQFARFKAEGCLRGDQVVFLGKLLGMAICNGFLNLLDILLAMLSAILFHFKLLFFLDSTRPNLHIVHFFRLVQLEPLPVLLKNVGVEGHD